MEAHDMRTACRAPVGGRAGDAAVFIGATSHRTATCEGGQSSMCCRRRMLARVALVVSCLGMALMRGASAQQEGQQQLQVPPDYEPPLPDEPLCPCEPGNPNSVCLRAAYPYQGSLVMMAEIPKYMIWQGQSSVNLYCFPLKQRAKVENFTINHWTHEHRPSMTHTYAKVICPWNDLARSEMNNLALLVEQGANPSKRCKVPLREIIHLPPSPPQPYKHKLCAMTGTLFNTSSYMDEWLDHQRIMGVEHIFAYVVLTGNETMEVPGLKPTAKFQEMVDRGEITLVQWEPLLEPTQIFYYSQHLAYNDYVFRFRGVCEWTAFADTDDFFIHFPSGHNLRKAVEMHERQFPDIDQIRYCWKLFYPDCGRIPGVPLLHSMMYGRQQAPTNTKHVTRTIHVTDIGIHKFYDRSRYVCGAAQAWHIRHGYPVKQGTPTEFLSTNIYCENFRLGPNFYQHQARMLAPSHGE